ncbi:MAG: class I SAM-dependent methyltransferase, partial [Bacteroidota bacterium]
ADSFFDLVIIDGRRRNECATVAVQKIKPAGIIIFDDTHREKYSAGCQIIETAGFKRLDFWGFANGSIEYKCSTLFYRPDNCLDI